ncbi:hypothetical protein PC119_g22398 [Phytophthora cactorum]|nr:hypothetical protein PC119_g22398 [Phytophthora cactorum]
MLPDAEKPKWSSSQWRLHEYDPNRAYTWPEKEDLYDSGLSEKEGETLLSHCFPRAIQVLLEEVCDNGHLGWILGPSGRGKSNTALAFALSVDRSKWVVTWIYVWEKMDWFSCCSDRNKQLFEEVKENLDAEETLSKGLDARSEDGVLLVFHRIAMIKAKYHYAGTSCRFMFAYEAEEVRKLLERAVADSFL